VGILLLEKLSATGIPQMPFDELLWLQCRLGRDANDSKNSHRATEESGVRTLSQKDGEGGCTDGGCGLRTEKHRRPPILDGRLRYHLLQ